MRAYIDSDILIWHLRGKHESRDFIRRIQKADEFELWMGALQRAEIVFFMRPGEEETTKLFLSLFQTASVDQAIIDAAGGLYRKWHPSHGIDVNDAILASTAMHSSGKIFTLNKKHYPMPGVLVEQAW